MRFSCKYDDIITNLGDVAVAVEDSLSNEDARTIIFQISENEIKLIGISQYITFKRTLAPEGYTLSVEPTELNDKGIMYLQFKSKELMNYLNSYKSLRRSVVEEVIFETMENNRVKCTVIEAEKRIESRGSNNAEEAAYLGVAYEDEVEEAPLKKFRSSWVFDSIPIKPNLFGNINLSAPEAEVVEIPSEAVSTVIAPLLPLVSTGTDIFSSLMFDDKSVVATTQGFQTIYSNILCCAGDVFNGIKLNHRCISFLNKLSQGDETLGVARTERHIYVKSSQSETFLIYDTKMANYKNTLNMVVKDHYVSLNRIYLKDVLKRLSIGNDTIEVNIKASEGYINVSNSRFSQDIDIHVQTGMENYPNIRFKIMPEILNKSIIGEDIEYNDVNIDGGVDFLGDKMGMLEDTIIYFCPVTINNKSQDMIVFGDVIDCWLSIVRVKTY